MGRIGHRRILPTAGFLLLIARLTGIQAWAQEPGPPALGPLLEDLRTVSLSEEGYRIGNRSDRIGHLELEFERGVVFPLRTRNGETLGVWFEGLGRFLYRSEDRDDARSMLTKAAHLHPVPVTTESSIGDSFDKILIFFANPDLRNLWTLEGSGQAAADAAASAKARADFPGFWQRLNRMNLGPDHLAAESRLNANSGQYLFALLQTRSGNLTYVYDSSRECLEGLHASPSEHAVDSSDITVLSLQELNGGPWGPHGALYLRALDLDIDARQPSRGVITSRLGLEVAREGTSVGTFRLQNHRDPKNLDWASGAPQLRLETVTDPGGRPLPFSHRYHEVLIGLPRVMNKGDLLDLTFRTVADLSQPDETRAGPSVALWQGAWFPVPAGRSPDGFTFTLRLRSKRPSLPIASGQRVSLKAQPDEYELRTQATYPVRSVAAFTGPYTVLEQEIGGQPIRFYTREKSTPKKLEEFLAQAFITLRQLLGPLPRQDIQIMQFPQPSLAMAMPGMIFLSDKSLESSEFFAGPEPRDWSAPVIMKMLASQWVSFKVRPQTNRDYWLTEGISEYLTDLATSLMLKPEWREKALKAQGGEHLSAVVQRCAQGGSLRLAGSLDPGGVVNLRDCLAHERSPATLQMLHLAAGDEAFLGTLRELLGPTGPDSLSTEDFRRRLEDSSQRDLGWFFDDWVESDGVPAIQVNYRVVPTRTGFSVSGEIVQPAGAQFKRILVPMLIEYPNGSKELKLVFQTKPADEFTFPVQSPPRRVSVDPDHMSLAKYR